MMSKQFEAWFTKNFGKYSLKRAGAGYCDSYVHSHWLAFKEGANHATSGNEPNAARFVPPASSYVPGIRGE